MSNMRAEPAQEPNVIAVLEAKLLTARMRTARINVLAKWLSEQDIPEIIERILRELVEDSGW